MRVKNVLYQSLNVLVALAMMLVTVPAGGVIAQDTTGPVLTITGATVTTNAVTVDMGGNLDDGYILITTNDPTLDHYLQFADGSVTNELLADEYFGLKLVAAETTVSAAELEAYYNARVGLPEDYKNYLIAAANGIEPFVLIKGHSNLSVTLVDAAQYVIGGVLDSPMIVPDDFPLGTYTVEGLIKDTADPVNTSSVKLILIVANALTGVTIDGTARVGETLTANVAPLGATADYQWRIAPESGGAYTDIDGATDSTYIITEEDVGQYIKVVATGTGDYTGEETSAATDEVAPKTIDIAAIPGVTVPVKGATPVTEITPTDQYTGTVSWLPDHNPFQANEVYTATITLTPKTGYTLVGVGADFFSVAGATSTSNLTDSGVVMAIFPATDKEALTGVTISGTARVGETLTANVAPLGATADYQWKISDAADGTYEDIVGEIEDTYEIVLGDFAKYIKVEATGTGDYTGEETSAATNEVAAKTIDIAAIPGVTPPATGGTPVEVIEPTDQYTGTVTWDPEDDPFLKDKVYVATITLTPMTGYTLTGVTANFFTVAGATASNNANFGVVTAVFPSTSAIALTEVTIDGTARVGETLTATVAPEGATADYQWKISDAVDDTYTNITNETDSTYVIAAGDVGKFIKVEATGKLDYTGTVISAATDAVAPKTIDIAAIPGVTPPTAGETPVLVTTPTDQYTGTVSWSPTHNPFRVGVVYIATITLTPKTGYTLTGVTANFFTVAGATASNNTNSGVVTAIFPEIPTALADTYIMGLETEISVPEPGVLANDSGGQDAVLTAELVSGPSVGNLDLDSDGSFEYTRPEAWPGVVTFTYIACDGEVCSAPATVTIEEADSCLVVDPTSLEKSLTSDTTGTLDLTLINTCDVPVSFNLAESGGVMTPLLLSEDFETGIWPPAGWTRPGLSARPWRLTSVPGEVDEGTYSAYIDYDIDLERDDWLITPDLDASSFTDLVLSFRAFSNTLYPKATVQVWVLDAAGDELTDEPLWDMIRDESWIGDPYYRTVLVDLSQFAGKDAIRIGWRYVGVDGQSFGLDNISIGGRLDISWITSLSPATGSIDGGTNQEISVTFDSKDLGFGRYEAMLFVRNAPYPVINVPVTLIVSAEGDFQYYLPLISK